MNAWVRSVVDRLASQRYPALAIYLFARSAPDFELAYESSDLAQGRRHKDSTTTDQILSDVATAIAWLRALHPNTPPMLWVFALGGMPHCYRPFFPKLRWPLISMERT